MNAEEYLSRYRDLNNSINDLLEERNRWIDIATKVTPPKRHEQTGSVSDKVGDTVPEIVDIENQINAEIDELVKLRREIKRIISAVSDKRYRSLLTRYYILGMSWEAVAKSFGRDVRTIYKWRRKALDEVEKIIKIL
ncbi:MAG: DUF1492 domain-containing protein [Ruminiclostridium sp.]